jgi:hypothetical protein
MSNKKYGRKAPSREARDEVLVVCGGQTERIYFDEFTKVFRPSLGNVSVITAIEPESPMRIVNYAIKARQRKKDNYNTVWCIFDKDTFDEFDKAIDYVKKNNVRVAFSNQAFEVWFINHFRLLESAMHRNKYKKELSKWLSFTYDKGKDSILKVCKVLLAEEKVKTAIYNSRIGYERHQVNAVSSEPSAFESSTTVYWLTEELLNWAAK